MHDATNADASSVSSADSIWDKIGALKVDDHCSDHSVIASLCAKESHDATNCDDSSNSSADSIWNKTGFPSRSTKEDRVETYYDYLRLQARGRSGSDAENRPANILSQKQTQKQSEGVKKPVREVALPPEAPPLVGATWRIVILMDHREFGCANDFLQKVEARINKHFGGKHSEITTLPSADYLYVARLISDGTGEVLDERVMDMVIERKNVKDVCSCLVAESKKFKPLSFFEVRVPPYLHLSLARETFFNPKLSL